MLLYSIQPVLMQHNTFLSQYDTSKYSRRLGELQEGVLNLVMRDNSQRR